MRWTLLFFATLPRVAQVTSKLVDLGYATYQSDLTLAEGVTSFLGIRYAGSPAGEQRWRAPQRPTDVHGVQNATTPPPQCHYVPLMGSPGRSTTSAFWEPAIDSRPGICVQEAFRISYPAIDVAPYSEDCLFLNVHVPAEQENTGSLPVVVYFHGGGYDAGSVSLYPVHDFVTLSGFGVVAVAIQYRLGVFGFLPGQKVKAEGDLNAGLLDQNFALQWVQKHISSFGGDPARVTIMGQSAGAGCMLQHVVAHGGNTQPSLFRGVIAHSPYLPPQYQYDEPIPEALYSTVASHLSCQSSRDSLACLRSADASALLAAATHIGSSGFFGTFTFLPVIDGTFIVERPTATLQRGRVNGEMLLLTTDADEGALFVNPDGVTYSNLTLHEYARGLFPRLDQSEVERVVGVYSTADSMASTVDKASGIMGEAIFVCPAYYLAQAFGAHAWKARFSVPPGFHAQDLSYEFSTFAIPPAVTDLEFLDAFRQSLMAATISMDPNTRLRVSTLPPWKAWGAGEGHGEMDFGAETPDGSTPFIRPFTTEVELLERCKFWESIAGVTSQ